MFMENIFDENQFLEILDLAYEVAQSLEGKKTTDARLPDCQQLALKLFLHAATAYYLRQGTNVPAPIATNGFNFKDQASVAVIARAAFETYLTLFEVFLEPISDDEFEFNYVLCKLSGLVILEGYIPPDSSLREKYLNAQEEIRTMKKRLQATA